MTSPIKYRDGKERLNGVEKPPTISRKLIRRGVGYAIRIDGDAGGACGVFLNCFLCWSGVASLGEVASRAQFILGLLVAANLASMPRFGA